VSTAGVTIQENADPDVRHDLLPALENACRCGPRRRTLVVKSLGSGP
jgi:thiamine phosphate synthase YjbQ (UPF0047 family)